MGVPVTTPNNGLAQALKALISVQPLTLDADPDNLNRNLDIAHDVYEITTNGEGIVQSVYLPMFATDSVEQQNAIGKVMIIRVVATTHVDDILRVANLANGVMDIGASVDEYVVAKFIGPDGWAVQTGNYVNPNDDTDAGMEYVEVLGSTGRRRVELLAEFFEQSIGSYLISPFQFLGTEEEDDVGSGLAGVQNLYRPPGDMGTYTQVLVNNTDTEGNNGCNPFRYRASYIETDGSGLGPQLFYLVQPLSYAPLECAGLEHTLYISFMHDDDTVSTYPEYGRFFDMRYNADVVGGRVTFEVAKVISNYEYLLVKYNPSHHGDDGDGEWTGAWDILQASDGVTMTEYV